MSIDSYAFGGNLKDLDTDIKDRTKLKKVNSKKSVEKVDTESTISQYYEDASNVQDLTLKGEVDTTRKTSIKVENETENAAVKDSVS